MNYYMAKSVIETQRRDFKKVDGVRFNYKGYDRKSTRLNSSHL